MSRSARRYTLLPWMAAGLLAWSAAACAGGYSSLLPSAGAPSPNPSPVASTPGPHPSGSPSPSPVASPVATYIGRVWHEDPNRPDHAMLSWAGVAAGLHFTGSNVTMQLEAGTAGRQSWLNVSVDGKALAPVLINANDTNVTVAANLGPGEHTMWLTKRTEASLGVLNVDGFSVGGGGKFLSPPASPNLTIEVIGASEEVGFGDLGQDCNSYDAVNFEDETLAWGHDTAQLLGAAESNLSFSGYGLLVSGSGPVPSGYTLQDFFMRADPFVTQSPWSFSQHPVDVVLFDLGSNDYNYYSGGVPLSMFEQAYVSFIGQALTAYPHAQIYVVLSPTIADPARTMLDGAYQAVVQTLQTTAPGRVHYFAFTPAAGDGCFDHPLPPVHAQMAQAIAAQIKVDMK